MSSYDLEGKKLLILGAAPAMSLLVDMANKKQIDTIVIDPIPEAPAKRIAYRSYNLDTTKVDDIVSIANNENVDGVITAYSDINLTSCRSVCNRLKLPFYATQKQIDVTTNKSLFKQACQQQGISTVEQLTFENIKSHDFPLIVKPVDNYGSKGITVCHNFQDIEVAVDKAKAHSATDSYVIEKYISYGGINIDYIIQNGRPILAAVGDRFVNESQSECAPLASTLLFPSLLTKKFKDKMHDKFCNLFKSLQIHNGVAFIQGFYIDNQFMFYEMGFRLGGGQTSLLINKMTGVNPIDMLINHAITGNMTPPKIDNDLVLSSKGVSCALTILLKAGSIKTIAGLDEVMAMSEVINVTKYYNEGDTIREEFIGTMKQMLLKIHIYTNHKQTMFKTIDNIKTIIKVSDQNGNNMILEDNNRSLVEDWCKSF